MKRLKFIYNPNSGNKNFKFEIDFCISKFQSAGFDVHIFRSMEKGDIDEHLSSVKKNYYDTFVVSGGDGTINIVVNALMKYGLDNVKLGIIPSGTANDFASFLKMPADTEAACDIILKNSLQKIDLGFVNGKYFVNVFAGGLLSSVSQNIDSHFKDSFGKLAYYIKGIEQFPNFQPLPVRITNSKEVLNEDIFLFIILNSSGTGGFENLSPGAEINDGLLDFIGFKACPIIELPLLILKMVAGDYLSDDRIIFFRDSYIKIESLSQNDLFSETDIDGEEGPCFPAEIIAKREILNVYGA